jgi:hypothetical protein
MLKKIFRFIVLFCFILIVVYKVILSDYNPIFRESAFIQLRSSIKKYQNSDLQPIVDLYNKIYQNSSEISSQCTCEMSLYHIQSSININRFPIKKLLYLKKIESEFTHDDCLKFELEKTDFLNGSIGVKQASKFYLGKSIYDLNDEEKIMFIVMLQNPSLYNPIRRKELLDSKVKQLKELINN